MLVDSTVIYVKAGHGGAGHVAFQRFKYIPKGGPSGGDGGKGGSVYLVATPGVDTLLDLTGKHHYSAERGVDGGIKQKTGGDGEDLMIKVPIGTLVYNEATGEFIVDLAEPNQAFLIAKGGKGGWGNEHFKSSTHQSPTESTLGDPGEELSVRLELKLIADIGIVGKPNAGKSTLLSRISRAKPKIADYPFTTLEPNLGIADLPGERRMVVADIPGLIEGAHVGHGLGIQFLKHIERTRLLIHLLEIEPTDQSSPVKNYKVICDELSQYSKILAAKPQVVVLTKMDLLTTEEDRQTAKELIEAEIKIPVMTISSATGEGLLPVLEKAWEMLQELKKAEAPMVADLNRAPNPKAIPKHLREKPEDEYNDDDEFLPPPDDDQDQVEYVKGETEEGFSDEWVGEEDEDFDFDAPPGGEENLK